MAGNEVIEEVKVSDMFDEGLDLFNNVSKSSEATNCGPVQSVIKKAMHLLEDATKLVSLSGMFSSNETIDEVATNNVKYFLLPALLGTLSLKLTVENRMDVVQTAEIYFTDFLQRVKNYGIIEFDVPNLPLKEANDSTSSSTHQQHPLDLVAVARDRNAKIQRYKEQKQLESKLEDLTKNMSNLNVDDEIKRTYFLTLIQSFANQAIDELKSIEMEKPLIEHMARVKKDETFANANLKTRGKYPPSKPLKPIIITRDEVQKRVFGAGYPSLPTMTVQEFYEKRVRDGDFPDPTASGTKALQDLANMENLSLKREEEEIDKEKRIEIDDEVEVARAREWDEFKDNHRRGFGNRMNRS